MTETSKGSQGTTNGIITEKAVNTSGDLRGTIRNPLKSQSSVSVMINPQQVNHAPINLATHTGNSTSVGLDAFLNTDASTGRGPVQGLGGCSKQELGDSMTSRHKEYQIQQQLKQCRDLMMDLGAEHILKKQ